MPTYVPEDNDFTVWLVPINKLGLPDMVCLP
jgi:hypothetical protein